MKINILLCDTFPGLLPPDIPSYEYLFENLFRKAGADPEFTVWRALDGALPQNPSDNGIYLITGSLCASYGDAPWILSLGEWICNAARNRIPMVGICFGHQLIAKALGGSVARFDGGWGGGVREMEVLEPAMKEFFPDGKLHLLCDHFDQVITLPEGAEPLAESPFCRYEGFRIGDHILTFQGHPEYTVGYARHLLLNHSGHIAPEKRAAALESIEKYDHQGVEAARFICRFFENAPAGESDVKSR